MRLKSICPKTIVSAIQAIVLFFCKEQGRDDRKKRRVKWSLKKSFDEMHKQHIVIDTHSIHNIVANAARLRWYT